MNLQERFYTVWAPLKWTDGIVVEAKVDIF